MVTTQAKIKFHIILVISLGTMWILYTGTKITQSHVPGTELNSSFLNSFHASNDILSDMETKVNLGVSTRLTKMATKINLKSDIKCSDEIKKHHIVLLRNLLQRTGNQMFQIFMLLATAKKNCYTPMLKKTYAVDGIFDLQFIGRVSAVPSEWKHVKSNPLLHKYLNVTEKLNDQYNYTFEGYFQNWKYFTNQEAYIRTVVKFKTAIIKAVEAYLTRLSLATNTTKVGVHVRRGDMVSDTKRGFGTATPQYIVNAMKYLTNTLNGSRLVFIIVSDDVTWCRNNIRGKNIVFSPFSSERKKDSVGNDLALLKMCDHTIITSGTFGWMGAWLSGGQVVYYKGYPTPGSPLDKALDRSTYYLPSWTGME